MNRNPYKNIDENKKTGKSEHAQHKKGVNKSNKAFPWDWR